MLEIWEVKRRKIKLTEKMIASCLYFLLNGKISEKCVSSKSSI